MDKEVEGHKQRRTVITRQKSFHPILDHYTNLAEVAAAIKEAGLGKCGLIFGIDYTMSNKCQGDRTFHGRSLHSINDDMQNPYQLVIEILGETLECFDDDRIIPAFGFGDYVTRDHDTFPLREDNKCVGFKEVLEAYNKITPTVRLHRPTNFGPLIREAIKIVDQLRKYHILVIAADGQVTEPEDKDTIEAIVEASHHPLSIIMIGVGDGPWDMMIDFDDKIPTRQFDNFQFVHFNDVMKSCTYPQANFALNCLMEIPDQYKEIKQLGYLD